MVSAIRSVLVFLAIPFFNKGMSQEPMADSTITSIYDFTLPSLEGQDQSLAAYEGKVILIVNVASKCGLTPQYKDLQALYDQYGDQGLVILGFPANNFMGQEPGTDEQIQEFCQRNYGVTFPMFSKISVKGADVHPLYAYLKQQTGVQPGWNFHKYLISRDGKQITSISPRSRVSESAILEQITSLL